MSYHQHITFHPYWWECRCERRVHSEQTQVLGKTIVLLSCGASRYLLHWSCHYSIVLSKRLSPTQQQQQQQQQCIQIHRSINYNHKMMAIYCSLHYSSHVMFKYLFSHALLCTTQHITSHHLLLLCLTYPLYSIDGTPSPNQMQNIIWWQLMMSIIDWSLVICCQNKNCHN